MAGKKISKKNQTNETIAAESAAIRRLAQKNGSRHFEFGEMVVSRNRQARVVSRPGDGSALLLYTDDGTTEVVHPYALAREA